MPIEILKTPSIQVNAGVTYHIYAIETVAQATEQQSATAAQEQPGLSQPRAIGAVAIAPSQLERYADNDRHPYLIHETMIVQGIIGGEAVYDKRISPRGVFGSHLPFYGLRIGIAKRRAAHRVKSVLTA